MTCGMLASACVRVCACVVCGERSDAKGQKRERERDTKREIDSERKRDREIF